MANTTLDTPKGKVVFFDDFLGKALDVTNWYTGNSDSGGTTPVILLRQGGVIQMGVDTTDNDVTSLRSNVNFAASHGTMTMEARMKLITSVADGENNIGFTDDSATDEIIAVLSTTDTYTATAAADFACFSYTGAGTANWKAIASKNGTDATPVACNQGGATTPVVGEYQTFKIVVNTDGDADFYINGKWQARIDSAITAATLMCFGWDLVSGGTARSGYLDYVEIIGSRATT